MVNVKDCEFAVHTVSIKETVDDVNSKSFKIIQNTTSDHEAKRRQFTIRKVTLCLFRIDPAAYTATDEANGKYGAFTIITSVTQIDCVGTLW